ncbi:MAG TPA: hypothetical protein VGZ68_00390 [Acidimicrobiales bacterium]|jgi:hypothetical protein|nr:hypothetical protein [Acidimicrobiales bacterium]
MMSPTEEDFELELRSLSGVLNVEIRHRDNGDVDAVTLIVTGQDPSAIRVMATQIVNLYYTEASVIVEDASKAISPREIQAVRVALVRTAFNPENGNCEVELSYSGRMGVGRAGSGQLFGGAEATLAALRELGYNIPFYLLTVMSVATVRGWPVIVTLRPFSEGADMFGIAQSDDDVAAAAMATLDALNRFLTKAPSYQ